MASSKNSNDLVSAEYRKFRRKMFDRAKGLCEICLKQGKTVRGEELDHITPRSRGGALMDPDNVQLLCKRHHDDKTAGEQHRSHIRATEDGFPVEALEATWPMP